MGGDDTGPVAIQPDDLIQFREECQAVRDEEDDTVAVALAQAPEYVPFCRHIDGGERVVENQEWPWMEQGPGQGDAGLLATGQPLAPFADECPDPGREGGAVLIHADRFQDGSDVTGQAEADIFFNSGCKEFCVVAAIADDAIRGRMAVAQFFLAVENLAAVRVFAEKNLSQRRFATGYGTGYTDDVTRPCRKGKVLENRHVAAGIGKGKMEDSQIIRCCRRYGPGQLCCRLEVRLYALP